MSKINDLIKKFCSNGVEYKQLQEIADTFIGLATSVTKHKASEGVILLHNSDIKQNKIVLKNVEFIDKEFADKNINKYYKFHDIATVHTGDVGTSAVIEEEFAGSMGFTTLVTRIYDFNNVNPYYLCHYFNSQLFKNDVAKVTISDRSNLNQKEFCQLNVPIPPIEVQNEIVRILDKFGKLEAELEAELEARKNQYEFWHGKLFKLNDIKEYKFSDLAQIITKQTGFDYSNHIKKSLINEKSENALPYIQTKFFTGKKFDYNTDYYIPKEVANKFKKILLDDKCILLSIVGASIGNIGLFDGTIESFLGGAIGLVKLKDDVNIDFIYHYLQSPYGQAQIKNNIKGSGQASLTIDSIREFTIPIPSPEIQNKIVKILDKFDKLINDISVGIPAEIELRRQQFEYYRNKLLSFEELSVNE